MCSIHLYLKKNKHQLLTANAAISTRKLTNTFGWDSLDRFVQHDAQELVRVLFDRLQSRLQVVPTEPGTQASDLISELFCGQTETHIECPHVNKQSYRREAFFDIQLVVNESSDSTNGSATLQTALAAYTAPEQVSDLDCLWQHFFVDGNMYN